MSQDVPFPKSGVPLRHFQTFIEQCGGKDVLSELTTTDVCERFVKPLTQTMQCSYCELLASKQADDVGIGQVFISHAWKYKFLDVIDALQYHLRDQPHIFVWFDLFSNNQHLAKDLDFHWWTGTFQSAIKDMGHTVMVFAPWDDPIPLTRAWCLWELFCTLKSESRFEVALSQSARRQFLQDIFLGGVKAINHMLASIDVRKSECYFPQDRERIFEAITATVGFDSINAAVFDRMRLWVIETAQYELEHAETETERLSIELVLAELYRSQGQYALALGLYEECLARLDPVASARDHPLIFTLLNNTANLYNSQGRYAEAEKMHTECLALRRSFFGEDHPDTLNSLNNLANAYYPQGKLSEALELHIQCFERRVQVLGADHPDTLNSMSNLANLHYQLQHLSEAQALYEDCLQRRRQVNGWVHPQTLTVASNLAMVYDAQQRFDKSEPMHAECWAARRERLGPDHPDTLAAQANLAESRRGLKRYTEAEELLLDCITRYTQVLGPLHPDTLAARSNLANLYVHMGLLPKAEQLHVECLALRKQALGLSNLDTINSVQNLLGVQLMRREYRQAQRLLEEVLSALPEGHFAGSMLRQRLLEVRAANRSTVVWEIACAPLALPLVAVMFVVGAGAGLAMVIASGLRRATSGTHPKNEIHPSSSV